MSVLGKASVLKLMAAKAIAIEPFNPKLLEDDGTYPLSFGTKFSWPKDSWQQRRHMIDLRHPADVDFAEMTVGVEGYDLSPGKFVIAQTAERLKLGPNVFGLISTRKPLAMRGLDLVLTSIFVPPGTDGLLDLETGNLGPCIVRIYPGIQAVKMAFLNMG